MIRQISLAAICLGLLAPTLAESCPSDVPPASPRDVELCFRDRSSLEALAGIHGEDPWLIVALGARSAEGAPGEALGRLEAARRTFRERGDAVGEAYAQSWIVRYFHRRRDERAAEAMQSLERMTSTIEDPVVLARRARERAHAARMAHQVDRAILELRSRVLPGVGEALPDSLRSLLLEQLAADTLQVGDFSEALVLTRRALKACGERPRCASNALYRRARIARGMFVHGLASRDEAARLTRAAYERSVATGDRWAELLEVCELGYWVDDAEALEWFERCAALAERYRDIDARLAARTLYTVGSAKHDRSKLAASIAELEAIELEVPRLGVVTEQIAVLGGLAELYELTGDAERALDAERRAVRVSERVQDRQADAESRAGLLDQGALHVYRLARKLAFAGDLAEAHAELERYRERSGYSELQRAEVEREPAGEALTAIREAISSLQIELRDPGMDAAARDERMERLEALESDEQRELAHLAGERGLTLFERLPTVSLEELQRALPRESVFVAYQKATHRRLPPWAIVVTRDAARAVELPHGDVEAGLGLYLGLLARRDGSEREAAEALARSLIEPVVATLPPWIERWIVVPDGRLSEVPFAALPLGTGEAPFVTRYSLSVVPSATQYVTLRRPDRPLARRALALAGDGEASALHAVERLDDAQGLPSLARAAEEARGVVRRLGGQALVGAAAHDGSIAAADPSRFGVLHLAAHALSNHRRPSRSALILRASDGDGLLQPREIARLPLGDTLVVLAACGSAQGRGSRGAGPMSLARAFLHAGAPAVVGTLWPVRDDEAARFAERFYEHLSVGDDAATALASAQRESSAKGEPARAWAGYVLIGGGEVRLAPRGARRVVPIVVAVVLAFAMIVLIRSRRVKEI